MTDPRDRLLHHALGEIMGESSEAGPDLSRTIREAWERGERRPAPRLVRRGERGDEPDDDFVSGDRGRRSTRPSASPRRRSRESRDERRRGPQPLILVAAAASVLVLGGTLAYLATRDNGGGSVPPGPTIADAGGGVKTDVPPDIAGPSGPETSDPKTSDPGPTPVAILARADRPLRVSGAADATTEIDVGQVAFVPSGAATLVGLPDEAQLVADAGTVFSLRDRDALTLGAGTVHLTAGAAPVALTLPGDAQLELQAGASVRVAMRSDRRAKGKADLVSWLADSAPLAFGVLDVTVERGAVQLTLAGGNAAELPSVDGPDTYFLANGVLRPSTPDELLIDKELLVLGDSAMPPNARMELARGMYGSGALMALRENPELWPLADEAVAEILDPNAVPSYVRREIVGSLAVDESPFAQAALRRAWLVDPEVFPTSAIVALAERGIFEFEREATAWFDSWDETAEGDPFPIALYLSLRDDTRGVEFLRVALEDNRKGETVGLPLIAAAGLARLGDRDAWDEAVLDHAAKAREFLADGDLEQAALRIDTLSYALALRDGELLDGTGADAATRREPRVGALSHWFAVYHRQRNETKRDGEALEEELRLLETS